MPVVTGSDDSVAEESLCFGTGQERFANYAQRGGVAEVVGLGLLESSCELVGVVEDLLCGSGHRNHLRYFGRAGMAWMMIGPSTRLHRHKLTCRLQHRKLPWSMDRPVSW